MQAIARRGAPLLAHALLLSVAIGSPGCGGDSQSVNAPPVAEKSVELQAAIERVIPIEAVYLLGAGEAAAPPDARLRVQRTIASMNRPFQRAGVQFYLRSYREVSAPVLAKIQFDNESLEFWAPSTGDKVRDDVTNIWGTNPWPSRPAGNQHFPSNWLGLSVAASVIVWICGFEVGEFFRSQPRASNNQQMYADKIRRTS